MTTTQTSTERRFRVTQTHLIILGLIAGVLVGWLFPAYGVALKPVSQLFLRLIKNFT